MRYLRRLCGSMIVLALAGCSDSNGDGSGDEVDDGFTSGEMSTSGTVVSVSATPTISAETSESFDESTVDTSMGTADSSESDDGTETTGVDPDTDPLEGMGAVEMVAGGFQFAEGPLWDAAAGELVFVDITGDTIHRLVAGDTVEVMRGPTEPPSFTNGLAFDLDGTLLACVQARQHVARGASSEEVLAAEWMGERLNSPNDVIVHSNGGRYFTDPTFGMFPEFGGVTLELDFQGVYRISAGGELELLFDGLQQPNGIGLSPDEDTLYVADTQQGALFSFALDGDGVPTGAPVMVSGAVPTADGLTVDANGNLYVTSAGGIVVMRPDGTPWGTIAVPEQPANCAFGGDDRRTLYITARTSLYRVSLAVPGLVPAAG